jgi:hypothetical protein
MNKSSKLYKFSMRKNASIIAYIKNMSYRVTTYSNEINHDEYYVILNIPQQIYNVLLTMHTELISIKESNIIIKISSNYPEDQFTYISEPKIFNNINDICNL